MMVCQVKRQVVECALRLLLIVPNALFHAVDLDAKDRLAKVIRRNECHKRRWFA